MTVLVGFGYCILFSNSRAAIEQDFSFLLHFFYDMV